MNKHTLPLLDKITLVETEAALDALLAGIYTEAGTRSLRIAFVNAHGFNMAWKDERFANDLMACDYVFRDGSGMRILYKLLGRPAGLNLNGTDLIPRIIATYAGQKIALMGTKQPYLDNAAGKIGGAVIIKIDGFQPEQAYIDAMTAAKPDLAILAMGMPRQERVADILAAAHPQDGGLIVCGGAILDFMGGKVTRAPAFFRNTGMEWIYRLALEPRRLFARYVVGNAVFLIRAILVKFAPGR